MRINACAALVSATRIRPVSPEAVVMQTHAIRVPTSTNAPKVLTAARRAIGAVTLHPAQLIFGAINSLVIRMGAAATQSI